MQLQMLPKVAEISLHVLTNVSAGAVSNSQQRLGPGYLEIAVNAHIGKWG
jgi:hypothetical protein